MTTRKALNIVLAITMVFAAPLSTQAQESHTWTGDGGTLWNDVFNWDTFDIPEAIDTVTFDGNGVELVVDMDGDPLLLEPGTVIDTTVDTMTISGAADGYDFINTNLTPGVLNLTTLNHTASGENTISGALVTSGAITVSNGTLNLAGANTIGGAVNVTGGTLKATVPASVASSTVTLDGGTFRAEGANSIVFAPLAYGFNTAGAAGLDGWNIITGPGNNSVFSGDTNPRSAQTPYEGANYIETHAGGDANTGIIRSDPFIMGSGNGDQISLQVGGGNYGVPLGVMPDTPTATNWIGATLEQYDAGTDTWTVVEQAPHNFQWGHGLVTWDTTGYIGKTMRMGIYDTGTGSWAFVTVDDIQISSAGFGGYGILNMPTTDIDVATSSNLEAVTGETATFGALSISDGATLTISGAALGTTFSGGAAIPHDASVGIVSDTAVTITGGLVIGDRTDVTLSVPSLGGGLVFNEDTADADTVFQTRISSASTLALNGYSDAGQTVELTKAGTGTMDFGELAPTAAANTTFIAEAGKMQFANGAAGGAPVLQLDGGTIEVVGGIGEVYVPNRLDHYGYHTGPNGVMDLNNNNTGGMMGGGDPTQGPTYFGHALLTDGPGGRGLDFNGDGDFTSIGVVGQNDNYSNLWLGILQPNEDGDWSFRRNADDDRVGIWLDLDQDGVFESSTAGLGSNRGEQLMWESGSTFTVPLLAGEKYMIAFTHSEGGGGSQADFQFQSPSLSMRTIKPTTDAAQDGLWLAQGIGPGGQAIDMSGTDVVVNSDSNLVARTELTATFGALTLNQGILNVTDAGVGAIFGATSVAAGQTTGVVSTSGLTLGAMTVGAGADLTIGGTAGSSAASIDVDGTVTFRPVGEFDVGTYNEGATATTLTVDGPGVLMLTDMAPTAATATVFNAKSGTLAFSGFTPLGGSTADLNMDGGTVRISSTSDITLGSTNLNVTNASTLELVTAGWATLGAADLHSGILTVNGSAGGTTFSSINVDDAADTGLASTGGPINVTAGGLTITNTTNDPNQNFKLGGTLAVPGTLTLGDNVKLSVDGGDVTAAAVVMSGTTNTFNFTNNGTLAAGINDGGVAKTFNVQGDGTGGLSLGAGTVANSSVFNLNAGGNMVGEGAQPLGPNGATLNLDGGTLKVSLAGVKPLAAPEAWFDSSKGVTVDASNNVTNWADQSGNARDAVTWQGTGSLTAGEINGLPAVKFGENENLQVTGSTFMAKDTFIVFRSDSGTGVFGPNGGGWGSPFGPSSQADADRSWMLDGGEDRFWDQEKPEAVVWNSLAIADANNFDMSAVAGGAGSDMSEYMILKVTSSDARNGTQARAYSLGTRNDGWSNLQFATAEVIAFSDALTAAEENDFGGYLAAKYGITAANYTGNLNPWVAVGDLDLSTTNVIVTSNSGIEAVTSGNVVIGDLVLGDGVDAGGMLSVSGAAGFVSFATATVANTSTAAMGFNNDSDIRLLDGIDFGGLAQTITKNGEGDLVLLGSKAHNTVAGSAFEVGGGRLIGSHASNPYGDGTLLKLTGGEIVLSSDVAAAITYDNPVEIDGGGTLTAGKGGIGTEDNVVVTLTNTGGSPDFLLTSGTVKLKTTDGYSLKIAGGFTGSGGLEIDGDVIYNHAPLGLQNLIMTSGSLARGAGATGDVIVTNSLTLQGLDLDMTGSTLTTSGADVALNGGTLTTETDLVAKTLRMGGGVLNLTGGAGNDGITLTGSGSALTVDGSDLDVAGTLTTDNNTVLTVGAGSTLTLDAATTPAIAINDMFISGTIDAPGVTITSSNTYNNNNDTVSQHNILPGAVINANLAGNVELNLNLMPQFNNNANTLNSTGAAWEHMVTIAGQHTYTGITRINRGALNLGNVDVNYLPSNDNLELSANNTERSAVLMGYGTYTNTIGNGPGQVRWENNGGGFAAKDGKLTVSLTPQGGAAGDPLTWNNGNTGFNSKHLHMGHYFADNVVEITNDIALAGNRSVYAFDNPNSDQDVARLSGVISGAGNTLTKQAHGNNDWSYLHAGTLELTNLDNSYGNTDINGGALRIVIDNNADFATDPIDTGMLDDDDSLGTGRIRFYSDRRDQPVVIEAAGLFERQIGSGVDANGRGQIYWESNDNNRRGGGFAAFGGPLTVTLHPGSDINSTNLTWHGDFEGFGDQSNVRLHLGSYSANDVVTLTNNIEGSGQTRDIVAYDNPFSTADRAVISGD
ncbi:MAG: hypothetical protein HN350_00895, partial [Phycisphaerales bacterium]|nr:hypothetical protein [Phycisphaerales bacterium]